MKKLLCLAVLLASVALPACAADFDWSKHRGETITFLVNNNTWGDGILELKGDFEKLTGINVKVDMYQEQQMRQRLVTVMNASSDEIDVFMTLPSREGLQFAKAGWYSDLSPLVRNLAALDYDFADFSKALVDGATFDGKLTSVPLNLEGPVIYYRKDIFDKCGVAFPKTLAELPTILAKLKVCEPNVAPFVSRGLKAALPYTYSVFVHNMGGMYVKDRKSQMCSREVKSATELYSEILRDYGPPGVVNYSFYQITSLYKAGKAAVAFEASNEFAGMMEGGDRLKDTTITLLPPGPGGSHPTVIGWGLAISAFSAKKEAAWYFLRWSTSPDVQAKLALKGIVSPRSATARTAMFQQWLAQAPLRRQWIDTVNEMAKTGTSEIGYPIVANPQSREYMAQDVIDVFLGSRSADAACAEADRQLDRLIAQDK